LEQLPMEWRLAGARPRGIISYGQLDAKAPPHLHRLFALEALLNDGTTWPADAHAAELARLLKPVGELATCRFADWRNAAVQLSGARCAAAIYSRPTEAFVLVANLQPSPQTVRCRVQPDRLPYPWAGLNTARIVSSSATSAQATARPGTTLDARRLTQEGIDLALPGTEAVLLHLR
jgi:hypothetical protein